ncbi:MAG: hypothetical protein ACTTKB_08220 [Treponema sp.]
MKDNRNYYPAQMNGKVISSFGNAQSARFSDAETIQEYLHTLSIDSANETELENIGRIIGYVRPLVPQGFNAENILLLGGLPLEIDASIGLADVGSATGGTLSTVTKTETGFMDLGLYRQLLKSIAVLKRYGITLKSVDMIASVINKNYVLEFDENADIVIRYKKPIGYKNVWILTQLFYRTMTEPQVLIVSGK